MEEQKREQVALFRYGLIAPLLHGSVQDRTEYLEEVSNKVYEVPCYGRKEYSPKTIEHWFRVYLKDGFEGLKPRKRSDKGKSRVISKETKQEILDLRDEKIHMPVTVFYEYLTEEKVFKPQDVSYSSLYRLLKHHDLVGKRMRNEPDRKRFAYDKVNALWQTDLSYGPYLKVGRKKKRTYLIAFIDDATRVIPYGGFFGNQSFDSLKTAFKEALCRRGIPQRLYTDNGKIYRSHQLQFVCASLGIALIHAKPYDPASKGKIERFFLTVRQRFYTTLTSEDLASLDTLNEAFALWVEKDYNCRTHSALGMSPLDAYMAQASQVKVVTDPDSLEPLFWRRETRKVNPDATISIKKIFYEVPPKYIGQRIEVRYKPGDLEEVSVFDDGKEVARVRPADLAANAAAKRQKSILRLSDMED